MITTAVSNNGSATMQSAASTPLNRDAFLKLLITQLRNQSPLSPMDDTEFIAQLAQFSSLEQMQNMNQNLESFISSQSAFEALNLIGRTVKATNPETNEELTGQVESIQFRAGVPYLRVQGVDIPLSYVQSVS